MLAERPYGLGQAMRMFRISASACVALLAASAAAYDLGAPAWAGVALFFAAVAAAGWALGAWWAFARPGD